MKFFYCSKCGTRLTVHRKALPTHGRIIELVDPHECLDEPMPFDLSPIEVPHFDNVDAPEKEDNLFVQKLNELSKASGNAMPEAILEDRRDPKFTKEGSPKSSAPENLLKTVHHNTLQPSTPAHDINDEPEGE